MLGLVTTYQTHLRKIYLEKSIFFNAFMGQSYVNRQKFVFGISAYLYISDTFYLVLGCHMYVCT